MTPCYYVITNIKGGDPIEILAFNSLTTDDFEKILSNYNLDNLDNIVLNEQDKENLSEFLKKHIHHRTVNRLIGDASAINLNELIDLVNIEIRKNASPEDLWSSLRSLLNYKNKNKPKNLNVKKLINLLSINSDKVESKLFNTLEPEYDNLAETSLNDEIYEISNTVKELEFMFQPTSYLESVNKFLKLANDKLEWRNSKSLIKIEGDRLKEGNWNLENSLVYSDTPNKEHLFMGVFKRLSSQLSKEEFDEIFIDWNKSLSADKYSKFQIPAEMSVVEFFSGSILKDGNVTNIPLFDTILELSNNSTTKIKNLLTDTFDRLFDKLSASIGRERGVSDNTIKEYNSLIKNLFLRIYPEFSESSKIKDIFEQEQKIIDDTKAATLEILRESVSELKRLTDKISSSGRNSLGEKYRQAVILNSNDKNSIKVDNVYRHLMSHIVIGRDIIRLPGEGQKGKGKWPYWVVNAIFPRGDSKILIYGGRINQFGVYEQVKHELDVNSEITYRKYDDYSETEENEIAQLNTNALAIALPRGLNYELAKNLLSVGDIVGNRVVRGIYPGFIQLYDIAKDAEYSQGYFSEIEDVDLDKAHISISKKLMNILKEFDGEFYIPQRKGKLKELKDQNSIKFLSSGDYFKLKNWEGFKRIIHSNENLVWTFLEVKQGDNSYQILKAYNRSEITSGIVSSFNNPKEALEINTLITEDTKTFGHTSLLSSFSDPVIAKTGDYVIYENEKGNTSYGKIIDRENEIALFWNPTSETWEKNKYTELDVRFMSKDARISSNSVFSFTANLWDVQLLNIDDVKKSNQYKQVSYVVNPNLDSNLINEGMSEFIKNSLYTKVGKYVASAYKEDTMLDKTEEVIKKLGGDPEKQALYVPFTGQNDYVRNYNNANLIKINGVENLSEDFIKENMLFKGVYFSVYNDKYVNPKIYMIEKLSEDKKFIYAREYFRNEFGQILLNEVKFEVSTFLNNEVDKDGKRVPLSLARYYLQKRNNKFSLITSEIKNNKPEPKEKETFEKDRIKLKNKLTKFFNQLGIEVEETNDTSEFIAGQHAKFMTTEAGLGKIVLKQDLGKRSDLVHETMHIYLAALRFTSPQLYLTVLNSDESVANMETESLLEKEEQFLRNMGKNLNELENSFFNTNLDTQGLLKGLNEVGIMINPDILPENANKNILDILKQPIISFLKLKSPDNSHPLYNSNLGQITPAFMRWLENENINLKCT